MKDQARRRSRRAREKGELWLPLAGALAIVAVAAFAPAAAHAADVPIDCDAPSDFCTGNPCTTTANLLITVPVCSVDFGTDDLVIETKVTIPNGGTLSIKANSINLDGKIDGRHIKATAGDGGHVSLTSTGDITLNKRIDVSGRLSPGSVVLDAGGNIALQQKIIARGKGSNATATGGTVLISSAGATTSTKRGKVDARGRKKITVGGTVLLSADAGASLLGRIDVRGLTGGTAAIVTSASNLTIEEEIRAYGEFGGGGIVSLNAPAGAITVQGPKGTIRARGGSPGGGTVTVNASGAVSLHRINATGTGLSDGGAVSVTGGSVDVDTIRVRAGNGGTIDVTSTAGDVALGRLEAEGKLVGGTVNVDAAADANLDGPISVDGDTAGGEARFAAGGNIVLGASKSRSFDADGAAGGVIEAQATGDLTVNGRYSALTGGCIGLIAGGTLTISPDATFSPTPQLSICP